MKLRQVIAALEALPQDFIASEGFGAADSYRGSYDQIAFTPVRNVSVAFMLAHARAANGRTFTGYKGGEYTMDLDTTCWCAAYGDCGESDEIGPVLIKITRLAARAREGGGE